MNEKLIIQAKYRSDRGLVRKENEDTILVNSALGIYGLADGLGGLSFGKEASELTLKTIEAELRINPTIDLCQLFQRANNTVYQRGLTLGSMGIGSTLTLLLHREDHSFELGHIGDSRAYLFRDNILSQLTMDHTVAQLKRSNPDISNNSIVENDNHSLTECIGQRSRIQVTPDKLTIKLNDRVLICSDGLTNPLEEKEIIKALRMHPKNNDAINYLHEKVYERGAPDNVSTLLLRFT